MAATRLIALHVAKGRTVAQSLGERTDYAKNPEKAKEKMRRYWERKAQRLAAENEPAAEKDDKNYEE